MNLNSNTKIQPDTKTQSIINTFFKSIRKPLMLITLLFALSCLPACSSGSGQTGSDTGRLKIVTTIFPEYDWVMNILGTNPADAEVTMLLDNGVDLHSFQPAVDDILKIASCDLFIYVGGESDEWVDDALRETSGKNTVVINLLDVLGDSVKEEEVVEGMQEEDHDHNEEDGDHHDHGSNEDDADHPDHTDEENHNHSEDEPEYDEHVWLSLRNAAALVNSISSALQKIDPANAEVYKGNTDIYLEKLASLDREYESAVSAASVRTLLFGDRFPFRYLVDDYGLDYYAAFAGCSAETEASFETITFLARKLDELSLPAVVTIESSDRKIAETIIANTQKKDQRILTMDSMQAVTSKDAANGTTYLSIMEKNLSILKEALNQ